jgi:16S rRNA (cytosine967-C5)-methyltransferase
MAKAVSASWTVRFVNAVLRKAVAGTLPPPSGAAVEKSIPEWLLTRWIDRFGTSGSDAICGAVNTIPPITVRTNMLRKSREELLRGFSGHAEGIFATEFSPEGISFYNPKGSVSDMPGFMNGEFQVQDEAAQLAGHILAPKPGETVLDACAGLGGKTGHAAQLMKNKGVLYAMDKDPQKLFSLEKEMRRLGISIVETCCHDLTSPLWRPPLSAFDRILLDAPCSGLGVLRRNPDAKWSVSESDLSRLHGIQMRLICLLAPLVKPSGVVVYVVCSTEPEENESVVEEFLKSHPNFCSESLRSLEFIPADCITDMGYFKTYPHRLSMDGFFAARLRRIS